MRELFLCIAPMKRAVEAGKIAAAASAATNKRIRELERELAQGEGTG